MLLSNAMLVLSLLLLAAGLGVQARDQARRTPCTFIWGVLFLGLFVVFPLVLNLGFGYGLSIRGDLLSDEAHYIVYGLVVLLFSLAYGIRAWLGRVRGPGGVAQTESPSGGGRSWRNASPAERRLHLLGGLVIPAGLAVFVKGTGLSVAELMVATRFEWFARGTASGLLINLGMYALGVSAVFTYYDVRFAAPRKWLSILVYASVLFAVFVVGDRKWLLFIGAGAAAGFYDASGGAFRRSGRLAAGLLAVGVLVFLLQFGRAVAWEDETARQRAGEAVLEAVPVLFVEGDATYFYRASLDAIRLNMDEGVVYPLAIVRRILLLPIPDSWTFGLKPEGIPFLFSDEFDAGTSLRRGNMPPGLVGLFVLSFGWKLAPVFLAALVVPLLGLLDKSVLRSAGPLRQAFFASYPVAVILLMRGSTGGVYFLFFNCAVTAAVLLLPRPAGRDRGAAAADGAGAGRTGAADR